LLSGVFARYTSWQCGGADFQGKFLKMVQIVGDFTLRDLVRFTLWIYGERVISKYIAGTTPRNFTKITQKVTERLEGTRVEIHFEGTARLTFGL
jgi:hypothetical protein